MLFGHGDDFYNAPVEITSNYSSNVWRGVNLEKLKQHLELQLDKISLYPEPDASSLRKLLARRNEISEDNVIFCNGSVDAIYLIAMAWRGSRSLVAIPTFTEYEDACKLHDHEVDFCFYDDLAELPFEQIDICWLSNPNAANGKMLKRNELLKLIAAHPEVKFVVDQSNLSFTIEDGLKHSDIKNHPNLILIYSLSKPYGIPGLRAGYLVAREEFVSHINRYKIPWSVNTLAIEASKYVLIHPAQFTLPIRKWLRETSEFIYQLSKLDNVEVEHSVTTYFLIYLKKGTAGALKQFMLEQGVLIRDASNIRGLDETAVRLCTQSTEQNLKFVELLSQWLSEQGAE